MPAYKIILQVTSMFELSRELLLNFLQARDQFLRQALAGLRPQ